ncbi:MAG: hypothetical protein WA982_16030 [Rubrobacteraceae bacterium]
MQKDQWAPDMAGGLRDGPTDDESSQRGTEDPSWKQEEALTAERNRVQNEERRLTKKEDARRDRLAAWKSFMQAEQRDLELRKNGQLAGLLGEPQPGESTDALQRLAAADQRQAEQELVTLMSGGKTFYKHIEELSEEDMPARRAAERLRTTWLKERRDGWLGRGGSHQ